MSQMGMLLVLAVTVVAVSAGWGNFKAKPGFAQMEFAKKPSATTVPVGSTVDLPCLILGRMIADTQQPTWTVNGVPLGPGRSFRHFPRHSMPGRDEEGDYTLRIVNVELADQGAYECQALGTFYGIASIRTEAAQLTVIVPPEAPMIIQNEPWSEIGSPVFLICETKNSKPAAEVVWLYDGRPAHGLQNTDSFPSANTSTELETTRSTITLVPVRSGGTVTCKASHPALDESLQTSVDLHLKPTGIKSSFTTVTPAQNNNSSVLGSVLTAAVVLTLAGCFLAYRFMRPTSTKLYTEAEVQRRVVYILKKMAAEIASSESLQKSREIKASIV